LVSAAQVVGVVFMRLPQSQRNLIHMSSLTINAQTPVSCNKSAAVSAFLLDVLAGGELEVPVIESQARVLGLLGEQQEITNSKLFRRAKQELGIRSHRIGFGTHGRWLWGLKTPPDVKPTNLAPLVPSDPGSEGAYAVDHSRSWQQAQSNDRAHEGVQADELPAEWISGLSLLETRSRPRDVPGLWWDQFIRDCQWFIRSPEKWAGRAHKLGWSTLDLFACCSTRPLEYLASTGLLWRLRGGRLKMLFRHSAIFATENGREYMFDRLHRRPTTIATSLPWILP
jgi:hypothetical protein